jgi:hypothetical protein
LFSYSDIKRGQQIIQETNFTRVCNLIWEFELGTFGCQTVPDWGVAKWASVQTNIWVLMGLIPIKKCACFFCAYLIRFKKNKQLCRRFFFNLSLFFFEKNLFENSTKTFIPFCSSLFSHKNAWENRERRKQNDRFSEKTGLNWKNFFYKVVSFFDTNQNKRKKQAFFFFESNPLGYLGAIWFFCVRLYIIFVDLLSSSVVN